MYHLNLFFSFYIPQFFSLMYRLPKNLHFTETLRRPVRSLQQKVIFYGSFSKSHTYFHEKKEFFQKEKYDVEMIRTYYLIFLNAYPRVFTLDLG